MEPTTRIEDIWSQLHPEDQKVLLAAFWSGVDVHTPVYSLSLDEQARLAELADFANDNL